MTTLSPLNTIFFANSLKSRHKSEIFLFLLFTSKISSHITRFTNIQGAAFTGPIFKRAGMRLFVCRICSLRLFVIGREM